MSSNPRHAARTGLSSRLLSEIAGVVSPLVSSLVTTAMLLGATAFLAGAYAIVALDVATQTVLTGSMRSTFDPGALVLTRPVPAKDVRPGDVIVFTPPGRSTAYTHRVVSVTHSSGAPVVVTKGDANQSPDAWKAVLQTSTVPRVIGHVPHLGGALLTVHRQGLHTTLLAVLGLVIAISGSRLILGSTARPRPIHRTA